MMQARLEQVSEQDRWIAERAAAGDVIFYTRGVDRITNELFAVGSFISRIWEEGGEVFGNGDAVWQNMVGHLLEDLGGTAVDVSEEPIRPDYDKLEQVENGADPSILGCTE